MIIVIDFGSQYTHLICRRIREYGVNSRIYPFNRIPYSEKKSIKGIILSGSPYSLKEEGAPYLDKRIFGLNVPILGICYGMQILAHTLGGKVERKDNREYGSASLQIVRKETLFRGIPGYTRVWMSHFDRVETLPEGFRVLAKTGSIPVAAMGSIRKKIYGVQFHPEVGHTEKGPDILKNFLFNICGAAKDWNLGKWIDAEIRLIRKQVGSGRVIMALSGGVDSSIASVLIKKAVGDRFFPVFVDHGLTRYKDRVKVEEILIGKMGLKVNMVECSQRFLKVLKGVKDPEKKRKIIGREFIRVFMEEASRIPGITHLAQGTLYPDVIESARAGTKSSVIKTHHNVGGLPKKLKLKLVEPFNSLYKDEVRIIGRKLGVPGEIIDQHPFPGPGLAVRIVGAVNRRRITILRKADVIIDQELKKHEIYYKLWQAFPVFLPVKSVGVMGDARTYENVLALRFVESKDAMTANWAHIPHRVLSEISTRIVNEIPGVNRVVYDITNKPPGTIEWE
ncbi:MAG: glutamine-hydrolyzing GMP synthase [Elusimicrobia bacterium]|nr:glutamine-hydrolyzing GMP synthase [Elusimicrobiota bacterium]